MILIRWYYLVSFFQTFKKTAIEIDLPMKDLSEEELIQKCWSTLSAENFNIVGPYAMDLEISVFDELKIKRGNLNQLNHNTILEWLPKDIPVSFNKSIYLSLLNAFG